MTLNIIKKINTLAKKIGHSITIMELCGTHTESVAKYGVKRVLPKNVKLLSGPGCPVCVTDQKDIDAIIKLALNGVPIACYGDVLRVPGTIKMKKSKVKSQNDNSKFKNNENSYLSNLSLNKARELGADINEVYSTEDALRLQKTKPDLVFWGLGFETTTPMTADAIKRGLTVYSSHKLFVPAMQALVDTPTLKIDGFLNPGHVSAIIGIEQYRRFKLPQVITGFEAEDVLIAIYMLLKQIFEKRAEVENEYTRAVHSEGNPIAIKLINEVFEVEDAFWRGLSKIPNSGLGIKNKYAKFDAKIKYKDILNNDCHSEFIECHPESVKGSRSLIKNKKSKTNSSPSVQNDISKQCICGAILRGLKQPSDCKLFNKKCTPENPVGACMVSSEGACGIEAKYLE